MALDAISINWPANWFISSALCVWWWFSFPFHSMQYRYASRWDLFVIILGVFCTLMKAFAVPWIIIVYGEFTSLLVERTYGIGTSSPTLMLKWFGGGRVLYVKMRTNFYLWYKQKHLWFIYWTFSRENATEAENRVEIINDSTAYGILTLIATMWQFVFGIFCVDCFNRTAIRQVTRIRIKYFESLMRQDIAWFDVTGGKTNFTVRITEYVFDKGISSLKRYFNI